MINPKNSAKIAVLGGTALLLTSMAVSSRGGAEQRPVTSSAGTFSPGTGTGQPSAATARLLRLMKEADTGFNARNFKLFLDQGHSDDVKVLQFGVGRSTGRPPHRREIDKLLAWAPDLRVHNDPYDIEFGQGQWTVAMGKLSGTFKGPMAMPDGKTLQPTGKRFETLFTTVAKWKGDQITEEYVMFDANDIMKQVMP